MVYASPAWERIYGPTAAEVLADAAVWFERMHPEDRENIRGAFYADAPRRPLGHEYRILFDDRVRWIEERTFPVLDRAGKPWRIAGLGADVTRRRELEASLRQSQKMEAIGQLAGGVAHDFNNMLTAIMASAEQVMLRSNPVEQRELCDLIVMASERAAELTRKLLSFSRKGRLSAVPLDVHEVVRDAATMLERSIDRRVKVKIPWSWATPASSRMPSSIWESMPATRCRRGECSLSPPPIASSTKPPARCSPSTSNPGPTCGCRWAIPAPAFPLRI
jgi:PAS domain S-box-containing protein